MCICGRERRVYASDGTDKAWAILEPLIPAARKGGTTAGDRATRNREWHLVCTAQWMSPLVYCHMICRTGARCISLSASGNRLASGNRSTPPCEATCASALVVIPNQVRLFSIANRSKPVQFVAISVATMAGKKIRGRKRHLLVDTQGLLMSVKVLEASLGDREGGCELLVPLIGKLPRLQVIWVDSGYAGDPFKQWVQQHLGVRLELVKHRWTGLRGVWAPEGAPIDWDKILPKGFHLLRRQMGSGTHECLDHAPSSVVPRF